jgi:hypothetical protein
MIAPLIVNENIGTEINSTSTDSSKKFKQYNSTCLSFSCLKSCVSFSNDDCAIFQLHFHLAFTPVSADLRKIFSSCFLKYESCRKMLHIRARDIGSIFSHTIYI